MSNELSTSPVIVGIDGSDAAINAAQWAVDEAVRRGVPLRLIYVAKAKHLGSEEYYEDMHRGRAALDAARAAVEATFKPVEVETATLEGRPGTSLVAASWDAQLIVVGSVGIGRYAQSIVGSTAAELAEGAHCPVAVIRPQSCAHSKDINWIVVATKDRSGDEIVVEQALMEATLRQAPVLLLGERVGTDGDGLDREVETWKRRYPDVHIYLVANSADVARFLKKHDERVQLAVIGEDEAKKLPEIVGPTKHPVFHHTDTSALVVRS